MRRLAPLPAALVPLLAAAPAAAGEWTPPPPKAGHDYPECYCTNRGERAPVGDTACLRIGPCEVTARCGMSLNNPAWRPIGEGCPPAPGASLRLGGEGVQPG